MMSVNPLERISIIQGVAGDILSRIEILPTDNPNYIKLKISFANEDTLHLRESWSGDDLKRYAYYWLQSDNTLKIGWDNAPHHPKMSTHPHHKHFEQQSNVQTSDEKTLEAVLEFIRDALL